MVTFTNSGQLHISPVSLLYQYEDAYQRSKLRFLHPIQDLNAYHTSQIKFHQPKKGRNFNRVFFYFHMNNV